jgi:NADH-quinone oxidoreductase subunit L
MHDFLGPVFSSGSEGTHALASTAGGVLAQAEETEEHLPSDTLLVTFAVISTVVAAAGILIAYLAYIKESPIFSPTVWATRFRPLYVLFYNKFYFDEIYEYCIVHPLYWVSDRVLWQVVDMRIIDGAVNGVASLFSYSSSQLRRVQTGFVANYALAIAIGAVVIVGVYFVFASSLFS